MSKIVDLHIHTKLSDGTFSPEKVVECAKAKGLSAIAITDHDSCAGIAPAIIAGKDLQIEVIPGVELSAEIEEESIHILGYFIDWQNESFVKKLDELTALRVDRAKEILRKLKEHDIELSEEALLRLSGSGSVGRLHIAKLMAKKGFVSSIHEAFRKYISNSGPCYVKNSKLTPKEAVSMIKDVGGIPVLAHPKTICIENRSIEDIIKELVCDGIQGIEVFYPDHSKKDEVEFQRLAEKYNLAITGGSDCHGLAKKNVLIGKIKVPYELVEKLRTLKHG